MASVLLPSSPGPRAVRVEPVDFGGQLRGPLGGATQRINRLGNRWAVEVTMPVMSSADARAWSAALTKGLRDGVRWQLRQVGLAIGMPGTPLVNGASQTGETLVANGFSASHSLIAGQFFSIITSARRYLYQVESDVSADGSGNASIAVNPPLRLSPDDNDTIEVTTPYVEGFLADVVAGSLDPDRLARGFDFRLEEAR